ncbi:MAG: DUF4198 domain-containing protein [Phycisphaerales bacterium]|nr:DUF4198 domain-containing protein [Phycisphaerales bacterium]
MKLLYTFAMAVVIGGAMAQRVSAHEFWIQPADETAGSTGVSRVQLKHGERWAGDVVARNASLITRFEVVAFEEDSEAIAHSTPVVGRDGSAWSLVRLPADAPACIVYETREIAHEMPAAAFEAYLAEEGLDDVIDRRAALGESTAAGREVYVRCARALSRGAERRDRTCGLKVEIVLTSMERTANGCSVTARVLREGSPLADQAVVAVGEDDPATLIRATTDANGVVQFTCRPDERWMMTTLVMERAEGHPSADWRSFWASTVFDVTDG